MKLHSLQFEKGLKQGVRRLVRSDPAVRVDYRRAKKGFRRQPLGWLVRPFLSVLPAAMTVQIIAKSHHLETGLFAINFWLLGFFLFQVQQLIRLPTHSGDIAALRLLPVTDETIFDWEFDKYLKGSLFLMSDIAVCMIALGCSEHFSAWQWLAAILLVPLVWAFGVALCALGAARFPSLPYGQAVGILYLTGLAGILGHSLIGNGILVFFDRHAPVLNLLFPTGWPMSLFHFVVGDRPPIFALILIPIAAVLLTWRDSTRILRARCTYSEYVLPGVDDIVPESAVANDDDGTPAAAPRQVGITASVEGIAGGEFLALEEWHGGWVERAVWRWLDPREKNLAEFAFPAPPRLTHGWYLIGRNFLITALAGFVAMRVAPTLALGVIGIGLLIVLGHVCLLAFGTGVTFRPIPNGGINIPFYAPFPLGMAELSRLYLKCFLVQWPFLLLLALAITVPAALLAGLDVERGLGSGLRAAILCGGLRLCVLGFVFISGLGDSRRFRPRTWLMLIVTAIFAIAVVMIGILGSVAALETSAWIACGAATGASVIYYFVCRFFYHHLRLDHMVVPR